jgi:hypothetical protein
MMDSKTGGGTDEGRRRGNGRRDRDSAGSAPGYARVVALRGYKLLLLAEQSAAGGALTGLSDLDLLVARGDRERVIELLLGHGFKLLSSVSAHDEPVLMDLVGYDAPSGRIVHVHLHFRLMLGSSLLKIWRPPWHTAVVAHAVWHPSLPVRVLDAPTEAILLLARACVEFDPVDVVALRQWRAMAAKFATDRKALAPQLERNEVRRRAAELLGAAMAEPVADTVYRGDPPSSDLRRRLRAQLAPYRNVGRLQGRLHLAARSLLFLCRSINKRFVHAPRPWSRRILGGGLVVAVLGVDGSGKSTLVRALRDWAGAEMDVLPLYFGTGDGRPSLLLLPLKLMVPLVQKMVGRKPAGASHGNVSGKPPGLLYSVLMTVWASVLAVEKRRKLKVARRAADRGMLAVTDRFPQNQLAGFNDGPLLPRLNRIPRWLRVFEGNAYELANRLPPDLVIKLQASPALIAQREPDMLPDVVRQRTEEVMQLAFPASRLVVLDASQPLPAVIADAKRAVWAVL